MAGKTLFERFIKIEEEKIALEEKLKSVKAKRDDLADKIMSSFEKQGIDNIRINGRTVYIQRQIWAGHNGDKQATCDAFKDAGLDEYISDNFNTQQISAYVREFEGDSVLTMDELLSKLPKQIQGAIKLTEKFQVKTRKA